jgi:hypothetical protein
MDLAECSDVKNDVSKTSADHTSTALEKHECEQSSQTCLTLPDDAGKVDIVLSAESTVKENSTTDSDPAQQTNKSQKNYPRPSWFSCCLSVVLDDVVPPLTVPLALRLPLPVKEALTELASASTAENAANSASKAAKAVVRYVLPPSP